MTVASVFPTLSVSEIAKVLPSVRTNRPLSRQTSQRSLPSRDPLVEPQIEIILSMDLLQFHRMRMALQDNAFPGSAPELAPMESNLRDLLLESGLFEAVEVEYTDDPDQLVIALCQFRPFYTEADVAARLEELWSDKVRYPFWEAHALHVEDDHVEFEAATRESGFGPYVTVHLVALKASIPAQRVPAE